MKLIQRIGYYLGGFSIGLIILAFFLSGKKTSCSYGPKARVLKNINTKNIIFSNTALEIMTNNTLDSAAVKTLLKNGDIDFSKSSPRKKPCGIYWIEGLSSKNETVVLSVENCDSIATITNIKMAISGS